jgi:hypothetical protein
MPLGSPRLKPTPVARALESLTPEQIAAIAPLNKAGQPDMMNYLPTRLVPFDEAKDRGWTYFYDARKCRYGHQAPHSTNNIHQCVDCTRVKRGKQLIGAGGVQTPQTRPYHKEKQIAQQADGSPVVTVKQQEPDRLEKQFLVAYAGLKDFAQACDQIGVSMPHMQGRMSWSTVFRLAVADLENRLGITHIPAAAANFQWNEDKHHRLIEVYVDTGDIATARDSIEVTPSEYYREMKRNSEFYARIMEAEQLAWNALEEKAVQLARNGNDKLLQKILTAKKPEYRDSLKLDVKVEERLTDDQLRVEAARLITEARRRVGGRTLDAEPSRAIEAPSDVEGDGEADTTESYSDLL